MARSGEARPMIVAPAGSRSLTFTVEGDAQTKGSAKAFVAFAHVLAAVDQFRKTGRRISPRAFITNDNPNAKAWQETVMDTAIAARRKGPLVQGELMAGAVVVDLVFHLARPQKIRSSIVAHTSRPDVDKLARCVLDALTGVVYADDGQVVAMRLAKQYAPIGGRAGVTITVSEAAVADPAAPPLFT
jgi:Holliday junction resolvase RusA-like endonuclease